MSTALWFISPPRATRPPRRRGASCRRVRRRRRAAAVRSRRTRRVRLPWTGTRLRSRCRTDRAEDTAVRRRVSLGRRDDRSATMHLRRPSDTPLPVFRSRRDAEESSRPARRPITTLVRLPGRQTASDSVPDRRTDRINRERQLSLGETLTEVRAVAARGKCSSISLRPELMTVGRRLCTTVVARRRQCPVARRRQRVSAASPAVRPPAPVLVGLDLLGA